MGSTIRTCEHTQKEGNSATLTFKVVNGAWNDGSKKGKKVTLTGWEGDTLKLTADQIPAVGSKPAANYKAGSWDVEPSTKIVITDVKVKRSILNHENALRFTYVRNGVAKVNSKGVITAKKPGTTKVYAQTVNGIWKRVDVKVTVK